MAMTVERWIILTLAIGLLLHLTGVMDLSKLNVWGIGGDRLTGATCTMSDGRTGQEGWRGGQLGCLAPPAKKR